MNSKLKKKKGYSKKAITFWSCMALLVLILVVALIIRVCQTRDVSSYDGVDQLYGQELYSQKEDEYYVLFYNFNGEREYEDFDKSVFQYLTYYRDNLKAVKLYGMDCDEYRNMPCLVNSDTSESIVGTNQFPNKMNNNESSVLKINEDNLPLLLVIKENSETGVKEVSEYKNGKSAVLAFLKDKTK